MNPKFWLLTDQPYPKMNRFQPDLFLDDSWMVSWWWWKWYARSQLHWTLRWNFGVMCQTALSSTTSTTTTINATTSTTSTTTIITTSTTTTNIITTIIIAKPPIEGNPSSNTVPTMCRIDAKVHWSSSGGSRRPNTLLTHFDSSTFV